MSVPRSFKMSVVYGILLYRNACVVVLCYLIMLAFHAIFLFAQHRNQPAEFYEVSSQALYLFPQFLPVVLQVIQHFLIYVLHALRNICLCLLVSVKYAECACSSADSEDGFFCSIEVKDPATNRTVATSISPYALLNFLLLLMFLTY